MSCRFYAVAQCPSNSCLLHSVCINIHEQVHSYTLNLAGALRHIFLRKCDFSGLCFAVCLSSSLSVWAHTLSNFLPTCLSRLNSLTFALSLYWFVVQRKGNMIVKFLHIILFPSEPSLLYFVCLLCFLLRSPLLLLFPLLLSYPPLLHPLPPSSAFLLLPLSGVLFLPSVSSTRFIFSSNYSTHTHAGAFRHRHLSGMHFWLFTSQGHCGTAAKGGLVFGERVLSACIEVWKHVWVFVVSFFFFF